MKKIIFSFLIALCLVPLYSFAAREDMEPGEFEILQEQNARYGDDVEVRAATGACGKPTDIPTLFSFALCIITRSVIPFMFGLAMLLFLVGAVRFVSAGDNEEKREGGRSMMIFGIICLFVMVSVWGLVRILTNTFGFEFELPSLPKPANGTYMK